MRATSSTRSASIARSRRCEGGNAPALSRSDAHLERSAANLGALVRNRRADQARELFAPQPDRLRPGQPVLDLRDAVGPAYRRRCPAAAAWPFHRALLRARIDTAFEAMRGIGHETVAARSSADATRLEERDSERHLSLRTHGGASAAHDARHPDRARAIGDHERGRISSPFPIEQRDLFTRLREAHIDTGLQLARS